MAKLSVKDWLADSILHEIMVEPTASCGFGPAGHVGLPLIVSAITVTSKLAVPIPPLKSVAVHVTVVVPIPNKEPDGLSHVGPLNPLAQPFESTSLAETA